MKFTIEIATLLALTTVAQRLPSFVPPDFPPSTIENDGTSNNRFDVRKTMAFVVSGSEQNFINSWLFIFFVTATDGRKFHMMVNPLLIGDSLTGGIFSFNDLQALTANGSTYIGPGTGCDNYLNLASDFQNLTSPAGSDNFTDIHFSAKAYGLTMDVHMSPTGKNIYMGGSGIVFLDPVANDADYLPVPPGGSWYWGNPHMRLDGTFEADGETLTIDPARSFAYFERQWGRFSVARGNYVLWLYFSNGFVMQSWVYAPSAENGYSNVSYATIWHPDGRHDVLQPGPKSKAWDIWISPDTGKEYFNKFYVELDQENKSWLYFEQAIRGTEETKKTETGYIIADSYDEGYGTWKGREIEVFGHVQQYSYW